MIITDVCGQGHGGATTGMYPGIPKGGGVLVRTWVP